MNFKIARKYLTLTLLIALFLSSDAPTIPNTVMRIGVIRAIPPTFITIEQTEDCRQEEPFPQNNPLPYYTHATQTQFSCDFYDKDYVAWTMFVFYELWEKEFGDPEKKVKNALDHLEIQWGEERREVHNVYDINGNFFESSSVSGLVEGPYIVWVWAEDKISNTSLVHELTHIALMHVCGSADPDHEGDKFACWSEEHSSFINDVNLKLSTIYGL
ncbi:MAG TPA: hypothetical protein EYF95_03510 [Flavobacteriales bacterium]|nr:hypothetical protein [Flavobacteriales bacterium]